MGKHDAPDPWTEEQDDALRNAFAAGLSWKEVAAQMRGRTQEAVKRHGRDLGLKQFDHVEWTTAEDQVILEGVAAKRHLTEIVGDLPGRTLTAVRERAKRIGARQLTLWTEEEDALVIQWHEAGLSDEEIAEQLPGRTKKAVEFRRSVLASRMQHPDETETKPSTKEWTREEDGIICRCISEERPLTSLVEDMPGRHIRQIQARGRYLRKAAGPGGITMTMIFDPVADVEIAETVDEGESGVVEEEVTQWDEEFPWPNVAGSVRVPPPRPEQGLRIFNQDLQARRTLEDDFIAAIHVHPGLLLNATRRSAWFEAAGATPEQAERAWTVCNRRLMEDPDM
jgi:hypothetical protein